MKTTFTNLLLVVPLLALTSQSVVAQTGTETSNPAPARVNYIMTNSNIATCDGYYYDPGYTSNYGNNQSFTQTIYPGLVDAIVGVFFESFNLEYGYDFLRIYNGPNTSSPLLGTFSGTTNPGIFSGANPWGALTFRFTSDGSITRPGWVASFACAMSAATAVDKTTKNAAVYSITLFPNPAADKVNVQFNALENEKTVVEIADVIGRKLISQEQFAKQGINVIELNTQQLNGGMYLLRVTNGSRLHVSSLVIER